MSANLDSDISRLVNDAVIDLAVRQEVGRALNPAAQTDLSRALAACITAESQIDAEQARIQKLWDAAVDPIERDARAYQHDLVAKQLERAATVARWRQKHLSGLRNKSQWSDEHAKCASRQPNIVWLDPWNQRRETTGLVYWFARYAWTYDPRGLLKTLPFYPFPFQEATLLKIERHVFELNSSLLIDKSRDMGMTWLLADWDIYHWRYTPGFAALLGNRTEDEVDDSKGDMGATFNKLRFQLNLLPAEMLPKGYDERRHCTFMNVTNPENSANISGGAPVEDFGRGDRRTVIQPDEFASWQQSKGYKQYQACSQTTYSIVITSTVKGVFNKYGELLLDPAMPKHVVHWDQHPWKDERWYRALTTAYFGPPMSATDIAQEVDRDPYASQPGQVLPMWNEVYHVITETEFLRVHHERASDPVTGEIKLPPPRWNVSVSQDVGSTEDHPNVTGWMTRPFETDPYPHHLFTIACLVRIGRSTRQIAEGIKDATGKIVEPGIMQYERRHNLTADRIVQRVISWEAANECLGYVQDCPEYPISWTRGKPDANAGIDQIQNALELKPTMNPYVIDPRTADPSERFAKYVAVHFCTSCDDFHDGDHLTECPRHFFVVPDVEGELLVDDTGKLYRRPAQTEAGFKLARYEATGWHYPESEKGKPVKARKPEKGEDDFMDQWRQAMATWGLTSAELSLAEQRERKFPEALRNEVVAAQNLSPDELAGRYLARQFFEQNWKDEIDIADNWHKDRFRRTHEDSARLSTAYRRPGY